MKEPPQARLKELFSYDAKTGHLVRLVSRKGNSLAGASTSSNVPSSDGYISVRVDYRQCKLHRLIWIWHFGAIPDGLEIDHEKGILSDCRIKKLRLATRAQNRHNMAKRKGNSKYVGVFQWPSGAWGAKMQWGENGTTRSAYLGRFDTEDEAYAARIKAEKKHHKEFAAHKRFPSR